MNAVEYCVKVIELTINQYASYFRNDDHVCFKWCEVTEVSKNIEIR